MKSSNRRRSFRSLHTAARARSEFRRMAERGLALLFIVSLLSTSTFAAMPSQAMFAAAGGVWQDARFAFLSNNWTIDGVTRRLSKSLEKIAPARAVTSQTQTINRISIFPGSVTLRQHQKMYFAAVAYDASNEPVDDVKFDWKTFNNAHPEIVNSLSRSTFEAHRPGTFTVRAAAGGQQAEVTVTVERGDEPPAAAKENKENFDKQERPVRVSSRTPLATGERTTDGDQPGTQGGKTGADVNLQPGNGDPADLRVMDDPGNEPGNPPGAPADGGAGSGNFQFSAPVITLPGRGIDLALSLNYNSRVWTKAGNQIIFDADRGNPAPGWTLGFGKILNMGEQGGMLVDADGTHHGYNGTVGVGGSRFNLHTTDGTFTDYRVSRNLSNSTLYDGEAWLSNGTKITYMAGNGGDLYPWSIVDPNGNVLNISYRNGSGQIAVITDTLNRQIIFNYDGDRLMSITAPRMQSAGGGTRTIMQLHYKDIPLDFSFSGLTAKRDGATIGSGYVTPVIDAIYYPATNTGYWFGDGENGSPYYGSYSSYGMLTKVSERRGMSVNAQGVFLPGTMSKQAVYNYPVVTGDGASNGRTPGANLGNAPMYDRLSESWDGMDTAEPVVTEYDIQPPASGQPRVTIVKQPTAVRNPDGTYANVKTVSKQFSYNLPGDYKDGLVYHDETMIQDAAGNLSAPIAQSTVVYAPGEYDSPRLVSTEVRDENNKKVRTEYDYTGGRFNQVTFTCDYDNDNIRLRCTRTNYQNTLNYIGQVVPNNYYGDYYTGRHIFNLVLSTGVENPDGTKASWTEYEYDGATLADAPNAAQHLEAYNPYNEETYDCNGYEVCDLYDQEDPNRCIRSHTEYNQCPYYDFTNAPRGNVTKVTAFADANASITAATNASSSVQTKKYDITGNVVESSSSCCELTKIAYTDPDQTENTEYAYPLSVTRGAANTNSPEHVTTRASYDRATGLVLKSFDADGLMSRTEYNSEALRPSKSISPTGAYTTYVYRDDLMKVTEEKHAVDGTLAGSSVKNLNGVGQIRREENLGAGNALNIVETQYNRLNGVWKQSRPFRAGETAVWTETGYDAQGRAIKITAPDGSITTNFYNEAARPDSALPGAPGQTIRVVDGWGRERWMRYDERKRVVEVVEANPNGTGRVSDAGSLVTRYKYDTLDKLAEVEQWNETRQTAQIRKFAYDGLGRLTRQKLAEQTAALDDAGTYVAETASTTAHWSEAFQYDSRSNLIAKTDARGVVTNYSYKFSDGADDPLNRLQKISYALTGTPDPNNPIQTVPDIKFEYETTTDRNRERLLKAETIGRSREEYGYDDFYRVNTHRLTNLQQNPQKPLQTNYLYDTLSRVTEITYPMRYGQTDAPLRRIVKNTYDSSSSLTKLEYNNQQQTGDFIVNAAGQTTSMTVGTGANQITETYAFDAVTGLLTNQKVLRAGGQTLLDLSYNYNRGNSVGTLNGKTGAVTGVINNLDRNKDKSYEYDALGRLTKAVGGLNQTWTQRYAYDRFGNRTSVTATGVEALRAPQGDAKRQQNQPENVDPIAADGKNRNIVDNQTTQSELPGLYQPAVMPPSSHDLAASVNNFVTPPFSKGGPRAEETNEITNSAAAVISADNLSTTAAAKSGPALSETKATSAPTTEETANHSTDKKPAADRNVAPAAVSGAATPLMMPPPNRTPFDFEGDGKADLSVWTRANGTWKISRSSTGNSQIVSDQFGQPGDQIAPGDYDGDGKTDEALWRVDGNGAGVFHIKDSSNGYQRAIYWGSKGDTIVPADYDGDGKTDAAVWRSSTGTWYVYQSSNGQYTQTQWGALSLGDIPVQGDFNGDGRADIAVWRPSNGVWYVLLTNTANQIIYIQWGQAGDVTVPADYDGDGKTDAALWRPSTGAWCISRSTQGTLIITLGEEGGGDIPVPANYDGEAGADPAVWRPAAGTWLVYQISTGITYSPQHGARGDLPIPSAYVRRSSAPRNQSAEMPRDGLANAAYDQNTNRITTSGFQYDAAGNQTRALAPNGGNVWLKYEYDAANRLVTVKQDNGAQGIAKLQSFGYGLGNQRISASDYLWNAASGQFVVSRTTYFAMNGSTTIAEYTEAGLNSNTMQWDKSYVNLGGSLLATVTPFGASDETFEYNHADRLGTKLVTNLRTGESYEQATMPFGTALQSESTRDLNSVNRLFTSYDRNSLTKLDYAMNRSYDSNQGRFTQVDPIGMKSSNSLNPQSLNLYAYCGNDPVNRTDPTGLFWGWLKKAFKVVLKILAVVALAVAVIALIVFAAPFLAAIAPSIGGVGNFIIGSGILFGASFLAAKIGAIIISTVEELSNSCRAPDYAGLSKRRQNELTQRGVSPEQWDHLKNKQKLGYFNITAAIAAAGLSLAGWLVDWAAGGIQQDRTFFMQGAGATNLLSQVSSLSIFSRATNNGIFHGDYTDSYRLNVLERSTQLSFTPDGRRLDADIDFFNPNRGFGGFLGHGYEVVSHLLGSVFGGTKTNPYNVAYRYAWECK